MFGIRRYSIYQLQIVCEISLRRAMLTPHCQLKLSIPNFLSRHIPFIASLPKSLSEINIHPPFCYSLLSSFQVNLYCLSSVFFISVSFASFAHRISKIKHAILNLNNLIIALSESFLTKFLILSSIVQFYRYGQLTRHGMLSFI